MAILETHLDLHDEQEWNAARITSMKLSAFKRAFERGAEHRPDDRWYSNLLKHRIKVNLEDEALVIPSLSNHLLWDATSHYLDYFLAVSLRIGIWAILPNLEHDHTFVLQLDWKKPQKEFPCKYAKLNFDPTGCMLFIGQCQNEDVYLGLCPRTVVQPGNLDDVECIEPGYHRGNTRLSRKHYNIFILFLARSFSRLPHRSINVDQDLLGEVEINSANPTFGLYTNLM
jgi:hypothetical protein